GTGSKPINDFEQEILVYKNGSFVTAQIGENLVRYGHPDLPGGASAVRPSADVTNPGSTDLFLAHSESGHWKGNTGPDTPYGSWEGINNAQGNRGTDSAPDYIVLINGSANQAPLTGYTNNNREGDKEVQNAL